MLKSFISWFASPLVLAGAGALLGPVGVPIGFACGFIIDFVIKELYPKRKMTIYLDKTGYSGKYWEAYADFLWYSGRKIVSWMDFTSCYSEEALGKHVMELVTLKAARSKPNRNIVYSPKAAKPSSIEGDIEHLKQVAAQYGVKLPEAIEKIEEIRRKTYQDEPPAKPTVTSLTEHTVEYVKDGRKQGRSRKGFTKQYGEPVLSKIAPEKPPKKVSKKAGQRTKA
jgi:hypothetical protein